MNVPATRILRAAVLLLAGLAIHCSGGLPVRDGSEVHALLSHDPPSMSLIGKSDYNTEVVAGQITDSLVQYDPQMVLQPRVAESWEFSPDRLSLTFHLREGVRWHDGTPVTAEDVLFTVRQVRDPAVENLTWLPEFQDIASIEAPDARTVRVRYTVATADVLETWRLPLVPAHLAESGAAILDGAFAAHPVGCGPFRFVRYHRGQELVLEANEDYWDGRPHIDRLVFHIYPDQRTAFQALLRGDLDVLAVVSDLWLEAQRVPKGKRLASLAYYRLSLWHIRWRQDGSNPYFTDARVRRAMLYALDRERFVERMLHGLARVAVTSYHPDLPWTDRTIPPIPYDPDEARRLLDEAGWVDSDGDGVRERDGVPFRFELMIPASTQQIVDNMAAWQQESWAAVGIGTEIAKLEWQAFRERRNSGQFDAAMGSVSSTPNPDQFELYHSMARDPSVGVNYQGFADAQTDRLIERGRESFDQDERMRIYHALQRRLHELQPIAALVHFANPILHDRRLIGIEPSPLDYWRTTRGPRVWRWAESDGSR